MELFFLGLALFSIILVLKIVTIVSQGYEYTVERFGRYHKTLKPGLHILIPFVDAIGAKVCMMESVLDIPSQDVITRDNAAVTVDGVVFYQVLDAARSAYEVANLKSATMSLTMTNIRTVMGSMDLDELLSNREVINVRLLSTVDEATGPWGIKVTRVEIKDIRPPRDLVDAMGRQMKAERDKRALILEAEGERQADILRAEGAKQSVILEAEGRRESSWRDAEARERLAQAEANAAKVVSESIETGNTQALNYFVAQKYIEALKDLATSENQKTLLLPLEVTSVMGSLAGIADLFTKTTEKP